MQPQGNREITRRHNRLIYESSQLTVGVVNIPAPVEKLVGDGTEKVQNNNTNSNTKFSTPRVNFAPETMAKKVNLLEIDEKFIKMEGDGLIGLNSI